MIYPDFYIVGAPKSGTTSLVHYLRQHKNIFMPPEKIETNKFCADLSHPWSFSDEDYCQLFSGAHRDQLLGEKSVWNLYSKDAAKNIFKANPQAKVIILLRNPVEAVSSLHSQQYLEGNERFPDFWVALAYEDERKAGIADEKDAFFKPGLYYREIYSYPQQVYRYIDLFGPENILIIKFENFIKYTPDIVQNVLCFLDVPLVGIDTSERYRSNLGVKSHRLHRFLYRIEKRYNLFFSQKISAKLLRLAQALNYVQKDRPSLSIDDRRTLETIFYNDIEFMTKIH